MRFPLFPLMLLAATVLPGPAAAGPAVVGLYARALPDAQDRAAQWDRCEETGVTDLFVQTFHGGMTIYPSNAERTFPQRPDLAGTDLLQTYIDEGHARGIRIHAWVDLLLWGPDRATLEPGAPLPLALNHPEWQVADASGATTGPLFVTPAHPDVTNRATLVCLEIAHSHREIDGIHLDYLRYPGGGDFTYDAAALRTFQGQGHPDPRHNRSPETAQAWRAHCESRLRDLGNQIGLIIDGLFEDDILVTVAVQARPADDDLTYQSWPSWLADGHIDAAVAQCFSADLDAIHEEAAAAIADAAETPCWIALACQPRSGRPMPHDQIAALAGLNPAGVVLFSDAWLAPDGEVRQSIRTVLRSSEGSPEGS
ncbi:MAG: family 10 glycosylhydrolase [Candidatus Sumerlaeia bacterium]|nr:family 10 glycosylhydrolase [Candidatus Sumerlaeia bacterium]